MGILLRDLKKKNKMQALSLLVLVVFATDISGSGQPRPAPGHASEDVAHASEECIKASDLEAMKQEILEEMQEEISKAMFGINAEEDSFLNKKNNTAVTAKAAFQPIFVSTLLYKLYN